jgi:hypothetical protein
MIQLLPVSTEQNIKIMPRNLSYSGGSISATIRQDGTNKKEVLTGLVATSDVNFVNIALTSTILKAESMYYIEFTLDGNLWYRDKIYATTQTNDEAVHTINENKYTESVSSANDEYIIL